MAADLKSWIRQHFTEEQSNHSSDISTYLNLLKSVQSNHRNDAMAITLLQSDLNQLHTERKSICEAQEQLNNVKRKQTDVEKRIQDMPAVSEVDTTIVKLRDVFADIPGLSFKAVNGPGNSVSMVFKNIDPTRIDREFVVTIEVVPNNVWKLIDVQPSVEGVAPLVNDLTVNTDFYKFARTVRALFKKSLL